MDTREQETMPSGHFVIYFISLTLIFEVQLISGAAPTGCSYSNRHGTCDFNSWNPPLNDNAFSPSEIHSLLVENVDGTIPAQAFDSFDVPSTRRQEMYIKFDCSLQNLYLLANTFTTDVDWLESLYIKSCYIQSGLPSLVFDDLTDLTKLEITGGAISGSIFSDSLNGPTNLIDLIINADFPGNTLIDGFLSGVSNVENIDLKSSSLTDITENAFLGLSQLRTLDLSYNVLTILPAGVFSPLVALQTLDLSYNSLVALSDELFNSLASLTSLDLSDNSLTTLPGVVLSSLAALQTLDISSNHFTTLPGGIFDSLANLVTLDVSSGTLDDIPAGLFNNLAQLTTLDLSDNSLTTLPESLFHQLLSLTSVTLTGNQWNCSCDLFWFSTWSLYTGISITVDCATPAEYNGYNLNRAVISLNCSSTAVSSDDSATTTTTTVTDSGNGSSSSVSLWETASVALAAAAILVSLVTVFGICLAYSRLKDAVGTRLNTLSLESPSSRSEKHDQSVKTLWIYTIWVQIVRNGYKQTTNVAASKAQESRQKFCQAPL